MHRLTPSRAYLLLEAEGHKYDPAPGSAAFKLGVFSLIVGDRYHGTALRRSIFIMIYSLDEMKIYNICVV